MDKKILTVLLFFLARLGGSSLAGVSLAQKKLHKPYKFRQAQQFDSASPYVTYKKYAIEGCMVGLSWINQCSQSLSDFLVYVLQFLKIKIKEDGKYYLDKLIYNPYEVVIHLGLWLTFPLLDLLHSEVMSFYGTADGTAEGKEAIKN